MAIFIIAVIVLGACLASHHHGRHFERNRRSGLTISESMAGPFGTRVRISKRF
jgi:hypothetical protein